jgi:sigma-E factor negative regulatory protein RseA
MMERLSAFMDGELDDHEVGAELARMKNDPARQTSWGAYHLIGDCLRGQGASADEFTARVCARLEDEPTVLAPRKWAHRPTRRIALPLAASLCGAAVVAWLALSNNPIVSPQGEGALPPMAEATPQVVEATPQVVEATPQMVEATPQMVEYADASDTDSMSDYLMAHQQFSPSTAMQGVVPYVRTVSTADGVR